MRVSGILVLLTAAVGLLSAGEPAAEVQAAEKAWARAVVKRDYAALEKLYDNDLIYAHSSGVVETKKEYIEKLYDNDLIYAHSSGVVETKKEYIDKLRTGAQRYDAIEHSEMKVRVHGDAAVVHCHVAMKGVNPKGPFDDKLMMLHLWVKKGGVWRLAAHQTTNLHSR